MTEQDFYQKIRFELDQAASHDQELSAVLNKIKAGKADFSDAQKYSNRFSDLIGKVLSQNVVTPGSGLNRFASYQVMKDGYTDVNRILAIVQKSLDQKQDIQISPQKAAFPEERASHVAGSLEDQTADQAELERRARNAVANVVNSFHDDYIQENAQFRSNAGLRCHVARLGASKCCAWCAEVAGRFEVGREPPDFWRRHDKCSCQINYENQKVRQRLTGNGKGWQVSSEIQRSQIPKIQYKPARFSPDQARETERKNLQRNGLTISGR